MPCKYEITRIYNSTTRIYQGVDADAVPGHRVAAAHADQREQDHHGRPAHPEIDEEQVVDDDDEDRKSTRRTPVTVQSRMPSSA